MRILIVLCREQRSRILQMLLRLVQISCLAVQIRQVHVIGRLLDLRARQLLDDLQRLFRILLRFPRRAFLQIQQGQIIVQTGDPEIAVIQVGLVDLQGLLKKFDRLFRESAHSVCIRRILQRAGIRHRADHILLIEDCLRPAEDADGIPDLPELPVEAHHLVVQNDLGLPVIFFLGFSYRFRQELFRFHTVSRSIERIQLR